MADFSLLAFTDTIGSSPSKVVDSAPFLRDLMIRCLGPGPLRLAYSEAGITNLVGPNYFLIPDDGETYRIGIPAGAEVHIRRDSVNDPVLGYTFIVTQAVPNTDMGI